jgi:hypothetical protein
MNEPAAKLKVTLPEGLSPGEDGVVRVPAGQIFMITLEFPDPADDGEAQPE